jgi:hypothetical protein
MKNKPTLNIAKTWSKLSPKLRRNIIAASIIGSTIPVAYSQADLLYSVTTQNIEQQSEVYEQTRDQAISTSTDTLSKFIQDNTEEITKALGVATKQEQVVGESIADTLVRTAQTYMSTLQTVDQNQRIQDAALKYGVTGQGYRACNVVAKNKELAQAPKEVQVTAATIVSNTGNQPGSLTHDATEERNIRVQEHRDKFCTVTEAQSGVCNLSDLPGGDTNASLLFQAVYPDSKEAEARVAVRRNMLGERDAALPVASARSPAGQEYLFALNHKASMLAFPAYSLAVIDAQNLKQFADEKGDLQSANDILEKTVSRYYGGQEALEWQKSMLAQEPRGLLVEAARIEGLEVWMDQQSYEQGLRMEGLLAALVLSTAEPFKAQTKKAERAALKHQTTVSLPDL